MDLLPPLHGEGQGPGPPHLRARLASAGGGNRIQVPRSWNGGGAPNRLALTVKAGAASGSRKGIRNQPREGGEPDVRPVGRQENRVPYRQRGGRADRADRADARRP